MRKFEGKAGKKTTDDWMIALFAELDQEPVRNNPVLQRIAVISTPRCGSTWICEALGRSGLFGNPEEWLLPRMVKAYMKFSGAQRFDLNAYLQHVAERTTTDNGVFTINFHIDHYVFWKKRGIDLFGLGFSKVIYLHRRDKVAQAYSYAKAVMSDQWRSYFTPTRNIDPAEIGGAKVAAALNILCKWDEFYEQQLRQKVDLELAYEDFSSDPGCFQRVFNECGIAGDARVGIENKLKQQRSDADTLRVREIKAYLTGGTL